MNNILKKIIIYSNFSLFIGLSFAEEASLENPTKVEYPKEKSEETLQANETESSAKINIIEAPKSENISQESNPSDIEQIELPEDNLGIDYLSSEIELGQKDMKDEFGVRFFFDYIGTLLTNPSGGYKHSTTYNQEIIYGFDIDLEKILDWKGASLVISGAYDSGANLKNSTGTFFNPSQVALTDGVIFYELYLKQEMELAGGNLVLKAGRLSLGGDFCTLPAYGVLVSGAMDANPAAIFADSPFTGSPIATWAISASYDTGYENISFGAALSQVPTDIQSSNWDGLNFDISSNDGYFAIFEMRWNPSFGGKYEDGKLVKDTALEGIYNLGGYFFGGYDPNTISGYDRESGYGFYIQGQQMLCRWAEESYISMWAGMLAAPVETSSAVSYMAFTGLQIQGFIPERINDGLYISYYAAFFSDKYLTDSGNTTSSEMGIEITYVFQLNKHIALQPDIQYVIRPNGDSSIDDALIVGAQIAISF